MLYNLLGKYDIILGSASPRRKYLLEEMGLKFRVLINDSLDETWPEGLKKQEIPVYLAELKGEHILEKVSEGELLITADTIVWMDGKVINKPVDRADAFKMLRQLSGNMHGRMRSKCCANSRGICTKC
jgi:septum formation protein